MNSRKKIGKIMKERRGEEKVAREKKAEQLNVSLDTLKKWENTGEGIGIEDIPNIAECYGISPIRLLFTNEEIIEDIGINEFKEIYLQVMEHKEEIKIVCGIFNDIGARI